MQEYIEIFKALSDETRLRLINLLLVADKKLCVCELTDALEIPQYNISKHLKILKQAGLIEEFKDSRWVYWSIKKDNNFKDKIFSAASNISKSGLKKDKAELKKRLSLRTNGVCNLGIQKKYLIKKV